MRLILRSCLFVLLLMPLSAFAQEPAYDHPLFTGPIHEVPIPPAQLNHVSVDVAFDAVVQSLQINATYQLTPQNQPIDSLVFSVRELAFERIAWLQDTLAVPLRFDLVGADTLVVHFDTVAVAADGFAIEMTYAASPKRGVLFKPATARTWQQTGGVLTQNVAGTTPFWLPTLGNPFARITSDLTLSIPETWQALGPGTIVSDTTAAPNTVTFASSLPHPIHQLGFAAGPYESYVDHVVLSDNQYVALTYLAPPNTPTGLLRRSTSPMQAALSWLTTNLQTPFPGTELTLLIDSPSDDVWPIAGHTFLAADDLVDQRAAAATPPELALTQALASRWIGQLMSVESWFDYWLQAGLHTYLGVLHAAHVQGDDQRSLRMSRLRDAYVMEASTYRRPLIWDQWTDSYYLLDQHNKARGAWVYHMLHQRLGDAAFKQTLRQFLHYDAVDTNDLQTAAESALQTALGDFFDQWVYAAGTPELDLSYQYDATAAALQVTITQSQTGYLVPEVFELDLALEVNTLFETQSFDISLSERTQTFSLPLDAEPRYVVLDPANRYLKTLNLTQSANAWIAQVRNATTFSGRMSAAQALSTFTTDPGVFVGLRNAFDNERSGLLRAAITHAVAQRPTGNAEERLLLRALDDPDPTVRTAALRGLSAYAASLEVPSRVRLFTEFDPSYTVQAQAVATYAQLGTEDAVSLLRSALVTPSHKDIIRRTALASLTIPAIEPIDRAEWSKPYYEPEHTAATRQAALAQIAPYPNPSRRLQNALLALLDDPAPAVRIAAIQATQNVPRNRRTEALQRRFSVERHPAVLTALEAALASPDAASN